MSLSPSTLSATQFSSYPPQARQLAVQDLELLRQLPPAFLPSILRELIEYDYKFPAERQQFERELTFLRTMPPLQFVEVFRPFFQIRLETGSDHWIAQPMQATEELSAYLWSTGQMDAFRAAATTYGNRVHAALPPAPPAMRRLGIAVIGQGVASSNTPLFRQLRQHGTYFTHVDPTDGLAQLLSAVETRAREHPAPYAHWYVEGGALAAPSSPLTTVSYASLAPTRDALLDRIQREVAKPGMGPEALRDYLAQLSPAELGMSGDAFLNRFQLKIMTEGSGTQIFSTTFAQWTAREVLRRAEALTLLVRFSPRQRQRPMSELLASHQGEVELDPQGSLVDADMAAYYHWINQQRLSGAAASSFVVWFEGHTQAVAVAPTLPRGAESKSPVTMKSLVALATS